MMIWMFLAQMGGGTLTYPEALQRALVANPSLQQARLEERAAASRVLPALLPPDPMVGYTWDPMEAPWSERGWMVAQRTPFPLVLWENYRAAQARRDLASWRIASARSRILFEVSRAYADLAYARALIRYIQDYERRLEEATGVAGKRYETGRPLMEATRFEVERLLLEAQLEKARAMEDVARARLQALLDLDSLPPVEGIPEDDFAPPEDPSLLQERGRLLESLRLRENRRALWNFLPSFQVQVMQMERSGMTMTQAMLTVPLFFPFKQLSLYRSTSAMLAAARVNRKEADLTTRSLVEGLTARLRALAVRKSRLETALREVETLLASVEEAYTAGKRSYLEWLDVYGKRFEILKNLDETRRDLFVVQARLRALYDRWDVK